MIEQKKRIYLPWLGEFGGQLEYFLYVKAHKGFKVVCHELGMDCLVPEADERYTYKRFDERLRSTSGSRNQYEILGKIIDHFGKEKFEYVSAARYDGSKLGIDITFLSKETRKEHFVPEGRDYDFDTDVVLFPRRKSHVGGKNWDRWVDVCEGLKVQGIRAFAAGAADMSYHLDCPCAWDYGNELEATLWAIKHSRLRVGPITAGPYLSLLCGLPVWFVVSADGNHCSPGGRCPVNWSHPRRFDWKRAGWKALPFLDLGDGWKKVTRKIAAQFARQV